MTAKVAASPYSVNESATAFSTLGALSTNKLLIVSAGKPFVAAALLILQADGRLSLDDDVRDYLPEFALPHPVQIRK